MHVELARGELPPADTAVFQKQLRQLLAVLQAGASLPPP